MSCCNKERHVVITNIMLINPHKPGVYAISTDPDQMPQNAASDQSLHCLLTECTIKF